VLVKCLNRKYFLTKEHTPIPLSCPPHLLWWKGKGGKVTIMLNMSQEQSTWRIDKFQHPDRIEFRRRFGFDR